MHCGDRIVDSDYHWELFLECLQCLYKYNPRSKEIKFCWDITLNVSKIKSLEDPLQLNNKNLLWLLSLKDTAQPILQFSFYGTKRISTV